MYVFIFIYFIYIYMYICMIWKYIFMYFKSSHNLLTPWGLPGLLLPTSAPGAPFVFQGWLHRFTDAVFNQ